MPDDIPRGQSPWVRGEAPPEAFVEFSDRWRESDFGTGFRAAVARFGDRPAVRGPGGQLTFSDLDRMSDEIASGVASRMAATREVPVAVWMDHDVWIVPVLVGIVKAGAMALPVDPYTPPAKVAAILADAGARLVVADAGHMEEADEFGRPVEVVEWSEVREEPPDGGGEPVTIRPDDGMMVFYTSGSTGEPKGVDFTHRSFFQGTWQTNNGLWLEPSDRLGIIRPLTSGAASAFALGAMLAGVEICLYDIRGSGFEGVPSWLRAEQITVFPVIATLVRGLSAGGAEANFDSIRLMMISGERVDPGDIDAARRLCGPDATIVTLLGSTETQLVTWYFFGPGDPVPDERVPIGFAVPAVTTSVVDSQGVEVPRGEPGELTVTSAYLARSYWRRPDLTALAFQPTDDGRVTFRTGDLARVRADGALEMLGREDSQVKIRGHRIELGAIEAALRDVEGITDAVAIVRDARGGPSLAGFFVTDPEAEVAAEAVRRQLEGVLDAPAVPSVLVRLDALPVLPNGKVDRRTLPEVDVRVPRTAMSEPVPPSDPLEKDLLQVWELVLGIAPIGVEDDLLELCNDSLRLTHYVAAAEEALGLQIPFSAFLEATTVRELASYIRGHEDSGPHSSLIPVHSHGDRAPLLFLPDLIGSAFRFRLLVDSLGPDQPLFSFESPLHDGRPSDLDTVEAIAGHYIGAVKERWPEGPYHLAGWSFGSFLAYEMARQLAAAGDEIALLVMVDAGPALITDRINVRRSRVAPRPPLGRFPGAWREAAEPGPLRSRGLDRTKALVTRVVPQRALDRLIWSYDLRRHGQIRPSRRVPYAWHRHRMAAGHYEWPPYEGDALVLTIRDADHPDRTYGLDEVIEGDVTVRFIAATGPRDRLMDPPWVDLVGAELREAMDPAPPRDADPRAGTGRAS